MGKLSIKVFPPSHIVFIHLSKNIRQQTMHQLIETIGERTNENLPHVLRALTRERNRGQQARSFTMPGSCQFEVAWRRNECCVVEVTRHSCRPSLADSLDGGIHLRNDKCLLFRLGNSSADIHAVSLPSQRWVSLWSIYLYWTEMWKIPCRLLDYSQLETLINVNTLDNKSRSPMGNTYRFEKRWSINSRVVHVVSMMAVCQS